jgi:hypothetical protein|tara:strand:+ start:997 stop:1521 length:525 start_codon:yes stop_codon:yes gene_type:complete
MTKETITSNLSNLETIKSIEKQLTNLSEWFKRDDKAMREMYKTDEYDSIDFSKTFNIETLIKAKEEYEALSNEANRMYAMCKMGEEFAGLFSEAKKAEAFSSLIDSGKSATAAEKLYRNNAEYLAAKEQEIKWTAYAIRTRGLYDHAERRHRSASQNISFLKQELNKNQFIDGK